nr:hypothetical protein MtrunA17_Chr7g0233391 [Ipomoea trifida]
MNVGNISTSPLSSVFGSPPPSPKGIPRTEMMVPRHTLERGESSGGNHDDSSSEEGEGYGMEFANRGLMLQVEDLFRFRHFRAKEIIEWCYVDTHTLEALGIRREYERIVAQPFWREICNWRDATYTPIVREFVATLEVNEEIRDRRFPSIKFNLFNKEYDISSDALGNLLGFYTLADQDQAWYADLVDDFESELQEDLFWWSIARPGVTWQASYTSARFNDTMEETRESELLDTIRRLEHRVDVLELEVRRIILDRQGEEPFELGEGSIAPR